MSRASRCRRTPGIRVGGRRRLSPFAPCLTTLSGLLALWVAMPCAAAAAETSTERHLPAGRFGTVTVYIPEGAPRSVSIFISGDGGWKLGVTSMASALREQGAVVIGVDIRRYLAALRTAAQKPDASCQSLAGDFETLSHRIQKAIGMSEYHIPVLVGYSSGATVVYAVLVQSPPGTFAGAMSLGFCADQDFCGAMLCTGSGLHYSPGNKGEIVLEPARELKQPWITLQGQKDQVCSAQQVDAFAARSSNSEVVRLPTVGHGFSVERNWMPQFLESYGKLIAPLEARIAARPPDINDLPVN